MNESADNIWRILRALAEDRGSVESIEKHYADQPPKLSQPKIMKALLTLLADGYVESFSENKKAPGPSPFSSAAAESLRFGLTGKGRDILKVRR